MNFSTLQPLGWSNYFLQQMALADTMTEDGPRPFRIMAIYRSRIDAIGEAGEQILVCPEHFQPVREHIAVGDWVLAVKRHEHFYIDKILVAKNRIERYSGHECQLIAANLDYLWIVTSANEDFNLKRLQRYLALAYEFSVEPVLILTKTDLADKAPYLRQVRSLSISEVHAVCAHQAETLAPLSAYCHPGNTIALVGSSGVGKSTLVNAVAGGRQQTREIRDGDGKGKHTTTSRQLFFNEQQVAFIDTPGMRELQLPGAGSGINQAFADIQELALSCKFSDCRHGTEPGCAVQAAILGGSLSEQHFANYQKLLKEDAFLQRRDAGTYAIRQEQRAFAKEISSHKKEKW
ncbi:ribosome small subunit-dependent GTPase A [Thalassomonas viridans]|uniref:Small ribosomal subunit biogenesis GTPase RsgA n=1 Tax=Thalassomonas viridans TaxID=137584 RepID=A0AAE9Z6Y2_9GAMM|nr:ribosome small subunit-dependent GTPase A [Thalassomonas viridans]WDE07129.1 ribosome small subunit-dependent GTPase A [Thalassomonas viridans]